MYLLLSSDNFSRAVESTYIGGNFVQVVKPTIVAVGWYPVYVLHGVEFPWSKYQQPSFSACLETAPFWFPERSDWLFLQMDDRKSLLQTFVFHQQLTPRYARCHYNRSTSHHRFDPLFVLSRIVGRLFIWLSADRMTPMALHLQLVCPSQQKEIAKGAKGTVAYSHMKAALHHIWHKTAQNGSARVVVHIGYHGFTVSVVKTYGVVVIVIEKRSVLPLHQGIIFHPLFF